MEALTLRESCQTHYPDVPEVAHPDRATTCGVVANMDSADVIIKPLRFGGAEQRLNVNSAEANFDAILDLKEQPGRGFRVLSVEWGVCWLVRAPTGVTLEHETCPSHFGHDRL